MDGFKVRDFFAIPDGIFNFLLRAFPNISVYIDHKDFIRHVDFVIVQLFKKFNLVFGDFNMIALIEETDTQGDIAFQYPLRHGFLELFLEFCRTAERDDLGLGIWG